MKRALVVQIYDRPHYLKQAVDSLLRVRGLDNWHVVFSIDVSPEYSEVVAALTPLFGRLGQPFEFWNNNPKLGVLRHPWQIFNRAFEEGYDYVLRTEDDVILSADVLEYHEWASATFASDREIGFVTSFADDYNRHDRAKRYLGFGSPLAHGTWSDRWVNYYRDTWDFDYSTNNGTLGVEAGWDWNLCRLMPPLGLHTLVPAHTKCFHVGEVGAHSTPELYFRAPDFNANVPQQNYEETR